MGGLIEMAFVYQSSREALLALEREQARSAAAEISDLVLGVEAQITAVVRAPGIGTLEQRREEYQRLLRLIPAVVELQHIDAAGREQLTVSRIALSRVGAGTDRSTDPAVNGARAGRTYYGPVYFRDGSVPHLTMGIAAAGTPPAVTIAEIQLTLAHEVVAAIGRGEGRYAYVTDQRGQLVAHPDLALVLRQTDMRSLPQVASALAAPAQPSGDLLIGRTLDGREVLVTYQIIDPPGWFVFTEQPTAAALMPLYGALARSGLIVVVGVLLATLASLLVARGMVRPIETLREGAARIGGGELDHRLSIRTGDELENVADEFNRMAARLQELYAGLERRIEERTQELAGALATIQRQAAQLAGFLSPQVAQLLASPEGERLLEGHRREITVVVCDMRGFTAFTEVAEPEEALGVLRAYQEMLGTEISRFGGTLEHFEGDGAMVYFNDPVPIPAPAEPAVRMAVAMRDGFDRLAQGWRKRGYDIGFGVGIATGFATLGRIGFEGRYDYGAIGAVVNLAHRVAGSAKPGQILVTVRVLTAVDHLVEAAPIGGLEMKGFSRPVEVFNVLQLKDGIAREGP